MNHADTPTFLICFDTPRFYLGHDKIVSAYRGMAQHLSANQLGEALDVANQLMPEHVARVAPTINLSCRDSIPALAHYFVNWGELDDLTTEDIFRHPVHSTALTAYIRANQSDDLSTLMAAAYNLYDAFKPENDFNSPQTEDRDLLDGEFAQNDAIRAVLAKHLNHLR